MIQCQSCCQALYKYKEGKLCNAVLQSNWFTCAIKGFVIYPTKHLIGQLEMHNQVIECKIRTFPWKRQGSAKFEHQSENKIWLAVSLII